MVFHRESPQFPTHIPNGLHLLALGGMDLLQKPPFLRGRHDMFATCHFIGVLLVGLVKVNVLSVPVLVAKETGASAHNLDGAYHRRPAAGNTITLVGHGREEVKAFILETEKCMQDTRLSTDKHGTET